MVSIGQDGTVRSHEIGYLGTALENEPPVVSEPEHSPRTVIDEVKSTIRKGSTDGKLVVAEEIAKGHVTWKSEAVPFWVRIILLCSSRSGFLLHS